MITSVIDLLRRGGIPIAAIVCLSLLLYERCASALIYFWFAQRHLRAVPEAAMSPRRFRKLHSDLEQTFQRQRVTIGTLIAAGPLLGLLGTVSGMIRTFESLSNQVGQKSVEGLAAGISEALISTEAGLGVAIPGVVALYYIHRLAQKGIERLRQLEASAREEASLC